MNACAIQFSTCILVKKRVILISLLIEPPSPIHHDSEATPLLPNSRNHDYEAALSLPNPNRSIVEAVRGECQIPSASSHPQLQLTLLHDIMRLAIDNDDGF